VSKPGQDAGKKKELRADEPLSGAWLHLWNWQHFAIL